MTTSIEKDIWQQEQEFKEVSKIAKKERIEEKENRRHAAVDFVCTVAKKKNTITVDNYLEQLDTVCELTKEELEKCMIRLGYKFVDFEGTFKLAKNWTIASILKINNNYDYYISLPKADITKGTLLFLNLNSVELKTKWLFNRLFSNIRNCNDERYSKSLYLGIKGGFDVELLQEDTREDIFFELENDEFKEKLSELSKPLLKQLLKKAWKDTRTDTDINQQDFIEFCLKFGLDKEFAQEVFAEFGTYKITQQTTKQGNTQLCFVF